MVIKWSEFNQWSGDRLRSGTNPHLSELEQLRFVWDLYVKDDRFREFHLYPVDSDQGLCIIRADSFEREFKDLVEVWEKLKARNGWGNK